MPNERCDRSVHAGSKSPALLKIESLQGPPRELVNTQRCLGRCWQRGWTSLGYSQTVFSDSQADSEMFS